MDVFIEQLILTLELNFFEAFNTLQTSSDYQLTKEDEFIRKAYPKWKKNNLMLLIVNAHNFREKIKKEYTEACLKVDDAQCLSLDSIILSALGRLNLESSNIEAALHEEDSTKVKVFLGRQVKKTILDVSQEMILYPFIKDIRRTMCMLNPGKTANQLYVIRMSLSAYLYKDGIDNLDSAAFTMITHYWNALNYWVVRHVNQANQLEDKAERITFWLEVLKKVHQLGDTHSVLAIYLGLNVLKGQATTAAAFALLSKKSVQNESEMRKKYSNLSMDPILLNQFHQKKQTIAPHVGTYKLLVINYKENIKLIEGVLQAFDLAKALLTENELNKIIKLYHEERASEVHECFLKICEIPKETIQQKIPLQHQNKTPQELSSFIEHEFEMAILKPYSKKLIDYAKLETFISEQREQVVILQKKMNKIIDRFKLMTLQAIDKLQKLLLSQEASDDYLSSIVTQVADTINGWNDSQLLVTNTQSLSSYTASKVSFFTGSLRGKGGSSNEDLTQPSSSCSPKSKD